MQIKGALDQLRREIAALTPVSSAGITKNTMHFSYIDQVATPQYPCLTLTVSGQLSLSQGNIVRLNVFVGVYTKDVSTNLSITDAVLSFFTDGFYSFSDSSLTIYSANIADSGFTYSPEYVEKLKAFENSIELSVECN